LKGYNKGIGDWEPSNNSCISAARVPTKRLTYLLENKKVNMTTIDEYNSSQNCANCFQQLQKYDPVKKRRTDTTSYSKLRHCLNCGHIVHRDQNASRNIKMIFECILNGEVKPQPFCNTFKELIIEKSQELLPDVELWKSIEKELNEFINRIRKKNDIRCIKEIQVIFY
jgi:hypothetical protein